MGGGKQVGKVGGSGFGLLPMEWRVFLQDSHVSICLWPEGGGLAGAGRGGVSREWWRAVIVWVNSFLTSNQS